MASQWFYMRGDQKCGPVTAEELKQLPAKGELQATDMVWKEGMAEWVAASRIGGLFPNPASDSTNAAPPPPSGIGPPPPLPGMSPPPPPGISVQPPPTQATPPPISSSPPVSGKNSLDTWLKVAGEMAVRCKAAGLLTAKQAQRTKIASITLPSAYRNLGRQIFGVGMFREEFGDIYKKLDDLTARIKKISDESAARTKAEGFKGKAKAAAVAAKEMTQTKGLEWKLASALGKLGEAAIQKLGEQSGPVELIAPISKAKSQIQHLDEEIARLSESKPGQILTPKRIAVGGIAAILLIGVFLIVSQSSSKAPAFSSNGDLWSAPIKSPVQNPRTTPNASPTPSIDSLRKAAEQGNVASECDFGLCYAKGTGVKQDWAEAVKWFRKAAERGHARSQFSLGACYAEGTGVGKDPVEAVKWFRKAADQGFAEAQLLLGICYDNGSGVQKDRGESVEWIRKAAEQGNATAENELGKYYHSGDGVHQDQVEACNWYRKAAEQGFADAQLNLGLHYSNGEGVRQDQREAVKWFRKAADQGEANAQYDLGLCYEEGHGVEKNQREAAQWYRKAAEQGNAEAKTALQEIAEKPAETTDALKAALKGKTKAQVEAYFGKAPDDLLGTNRWSYTRPVTDSDSGVTFERATIEIWFDLDDKAFGVVFKK